MGRAPTGGDPARRRCPGRGTEGTHLPNPLPPGVITERARRLRALGRAKNLAFRQRFAGNEVEVLVLETRDKATGLLSGLTSDYLEVLFPGDDRLMRRYLATRVIEITPDRTFGMLVGP